MDEGLSALSMQVGMLTERQRAMDERQRTMDRRLKALESPQDRPGLAKTLRAIATPREWAAVLAVALLALMGIVTPEEVRDKIRSVLDLPPIIRQGPG